MSEPLGLSAWLPTDPPARTREEALARYAGIGHAEWLLEEEKELLERVADAGGRYLATVSLHDPAWSRRPDPRLRHLEHRCLACQAAADAYESAVNIYLEHQVRP